MNKKQLLEYITNDYDQIDSISINFLDGERESISLIHTQLNSRSNIHSHNDVHPLYPSYNPQPPITRSTTTIQNNLTKLLRLATIHRQSESRFIATTDIQHIISMISVSRKQILLLESVNNMYNYLLRKKCTHARNNSIHSRCEVCTGAIAIFNNYPDITQFWREVYSLLEEELNYPHRTITYHTHLFNQWCNDNGVDNIGNLATIDKTNISNSIRAGHLIYELFHTTGSFITFLIPTNQLIRLIPTTDSDFQTLCSELIRSINNSVAFTSHLHQESTHNQLVDVSINTNS